MELPLKNFEIPDGYYVDKEYGFLEAYPRHSKMAVHIFTAVRKNLFVQAYRAGKTSVKKLCKELKINFETYKHHLKIDPIFRERIADARLELIESVEQVLYQCALNPAKSDDRKFWLKYNYPEKYGDKSKNEGIEIRIDLGQLAGFFEHDRMVESRVSGRVENPELECMDKALLKETENIMCSKESNRVLLLTHQPALAKAAL